MDPNISRRGIRELADKITGPGGSMIDAVSLAEGVKALDDWLTGGGFLPEVWRDAQQGFVERTPERPPAPLFPGVAWWGRTYLAGTCQGCQRAAQVREGYIGGQKTAVVACQGCISRSAAAVRPFRERS